MRFLPLTRQVELEESNPENLVTASTGDLFYRKGNDLFYVVKPNGQRDRVYIPRKSFALKYRNQAWYFHTDENSIIFENVCEIWKKTGAGHNSKGWQYLSNKSLDSTDAPLSETE